MITPPTELDALFHFSGADVAGLPLAVSVSDSGNYSLNLTADADPTHSPILPGTPLTRALYTLEYQTNSLLGSQVTFVVAPLPGDFNGDGIDDAADYTVWSDSLGSTTNLAADGNGNGTIDALDYTIWLSNFGRTMTSGGSSNRRRRRPRASVLAVDAIRRGRSHGILSITSTPSPSAKVILSTDHQSTTDDSVVPSTLNPSL